MSATFPCLDEIFRRRPLLSLDEVVELTGFRRRPLLDDCRAKRVLCSYRSQDFFFNKEQLELLLASASQPVVRPSARPKPNVAVTAASSSVDVDAWAARKRQQLARKAG